MVPGGLQCIWIQKNQGLRAFALGSFCNDSKIDSKMIQLIVVFEPHIVWRDQTWYNQGNAMRGWYGYGKGD